MKETIKNLLEQLTIEYGFSGKTISNTEKTERFILSDDLGIIGYLEFNNGVWQFFYDKLYKQDTSKNAIFDFPDKDKIYETEVLWPFFLVRIPSIKQPRIQKIIQKNQINPNNLVELLDRFGKKSISNPYQLIHQ